VPVDLSEDHGGLGRGVLGEVIAGDLVPTRSVDDRMNALRNWPKFCPRGSAS
jgi:hypothetical protein